MEKRGALSERSKNWLVALAANGLIAICIFALTDLTYETNDDFALSARIADGYPYVEFFNYYLSRFLIAIQAHAGGLNIYVVFLILISFICFVYFTKIILDACDSLPVRIMLLSALIIFSFDHYCAIQFTKTGALVITTGFIALTDSVINRKGVTGYIGPFLLVYTGTAIRFETLTAALGMAAVSIAAWMFTDRKMRREEDWFSPRRLGTAALVIVMIAGAYGFIELSRIQNTGTPELKDAYEYSLVRTNIVDYPTYVYYEDNKNKYDAIGISENDLFLIDKWHLDYDGAASLENLKKIDSIERPLPEMKIRVIGSFRKSLRYVLDGMLNRSSNGIHIIALFILAAAMLITLKPKRWLYVIVMGGVAFGLYVALYYTQRTNYRAFYLADLGTMLWLLYYYAVCTEREPGRSSTWLAYVPAVLMLAAALMFIDPLADNCHNKFERTGSSVMSEEAEAYFNEHKDKAFVWATGEKKMSRCYNDPLKAPDGSDGNVFNTGGWSAMTPYILDKLAAYGMHSPIADLVDNDNAYYIGEKYTVRLEQYLTKWYAGEEEEVRLEQVYTIDGNPVWKAVSVRKDQADG